MIYLDVTCIIIIRKDILHDIRYLVYNIMYMQSCYVLFSCKYETSYMQIYVISFFLHPVGAVLHFLERESISKQVCIFLFAIIFLPFAVHKTLQQLLFRFLVYQVFVWDVKQQLWFTAPLKQNVSCESVAKSSCLAACIS